MSKVAGIGAGRRRFCPGTVGARTVVGDGADAGDAATPIVRIPRGLAPTAVLLLVGL